MSALDRVAAPPLRPSPALREPARAAVRLLPVLRRPAALLRRVSAVPGHASRRPVPSSQPAPPVRPPPPPRAEVRPAPRAADAPSDTAPQVAEGPGVAAPSPDAARRGGAASGRRLGKAGGRAARPARAGHRALSLRRPRARPRVRAPPGRPGTAPPSRPTGPRRRTGRGTPVRPPPAHGHRRGRARSRATRVHGPARRRDPLLPEAHHRQPRRRDRRSRSAPRPCRHRRRPPTTVPLRPPRRARWSSYARARRYAVGSPPRPRSVPSNRASRARRRPPLPQQSGHARPDAVPAAATSDAPRLGPRVSIQIGEVRISTAPQRAAPAVQRRSSPPRGHAVDPRLRLRSGGW